MQAEEGVVYSYRGRKLVYLPEDGGKGGEGEAEVLGLVIAGRFFRLGKPRVADPALCRRCGECCMSVSKVRATPADIQRWIEEEREEVLSRLRITEREGVLVTDGTLRLGDSGCSFLEAGAEGYACRIHDTKPEVCAEYPLNVGGVCRAGVDFRR